MTGSQYKNVAQWTLANTPGVEAMDSADAARAIFNNLGVAFPNGSCEEILLTLMSEDYMGWTPCTYRQAQEYANAGVAAVGVDTSRVVVILPDESADSVIASADAAVVSTSAKQTSDIAATERMGMQFYAYAASTTTTVTPTTPMMTNVEYYNNIHNTPLIPASGGTTYCNIWLHNMLDRCNIPYPTGGCTAELEKYQKGYDQWKSCDFKEAQSHANMGYAAIGITKYHVVAVTPNNIPPRSGSVPSTVGDVLVSQSGSDCFYDKTLSWAWTKADRDSVEFFYYNK